MNLGNRVFVGAVFFSTLSLHAVEEIKLDEAALNTAKILIKENDFQESIVLAFRLLREGTDQGVRGDARKLLIRLGFSKLELLEFEPASAKPEELDKMVARASVEFNAVHRHKLAMNYCEGLLKSAASPRCGRDGKIILEVHSQSILRAIEILLDSVLSDDPEDAQEAQEWLVYMGIKGTKVELARQAIAQRKLPSEFQDEAVAAVCLMRLKEYQSTVTDDDNDEDSATRRRVALKMGLALNAYVNEHHAHTAVFKRETPTLDFWRGQHPKLTPDNF